MKNLPLSPCGHINSDSTFDQALWQQAAELGWLGLTIPENFGAGLKWIDLIEVWKPLLKVCVRFPSLLKHWPAPPF